MTEDSLCYKVQRDYMLRVAGQLCCGPSAVYVSSETQVNWTISTYGKLVLRYLGVQNH